MFRSYALQEQAKPVHMQSLPCESHDGSDLFVIQVPAAAHLPRSDQVASRLHAHKTASRHVLVSCKHLQPALQIGNAKDYAERLHELA